MKVEICDEFAHELQSMTTLNPKGRDLDYFADWFLRVGLQTVKAGLKKYPELTLGELMTMSYRNHDYH